MIIEGRFEIDAPRETLFPRLVDPATLAACLPGCESIEATGPASYRAAVAVALGAIAARFKLEVEITEQTPPERVLAVIRALPEAYRVKSVVAVQPGADQRRVAKVSIQVFRQRLRVPRAAGIGERIGNRSGQDGVHATGRAGLLQNRQKGVCHGLQQACHVLAGAHRHIGRSAVEQAGRKIQLASHLSRAVLWKHRPHHVGNGFAEDVGLNDDGRRFPVGFGQQRDFLATGRGGPRIDGHRPG